MIKEELLQQIQNCADPNRAIDHKRYHKSNRIHWGISAPQCDQLVRSFSKGLQEKELLAMAETLWMTDMFDPMMCAAKILDLRCVKPSQSLWNIIKKFLKNVDGWALEDGLAHAAWKCVLANEKLLNDIEEWTIHPNFWMRRAALVYTLPFAKPGRDPERMLQWASTYASDSEWFIQKAIGWWLRVLGAHHPYRVISFLENHWHQLKNVAKKEATRKLSIELQQKVLLFKDRIPESQCMITFES